MEFIHIQKNIHTSPRKLRLVTDMVRGMSPDKAVVTLQFTQKSAALPLAKAIQTALANAKNTNPNLGGLIFKSLEVNEGLRMKRMRAAGRSHRQPYQRKTSQIRVILTDVKGVI